LKLLKKLWRWQEFVRHSTRYIQAVWKIATQAQKGAVLKNSGPFRRDSFAGRATKPPATRQILKGHTIREQLGSCLWPNACDTLDVIARVAGKRSVVTPLRWRHSESLSDGRCSYRTGLHAACSVQDRNGWTDQLIIVFVSRNHVTATFGVGGDERAHKVITLYVVKLEPAYPLDGKPGFNVW
jgi:hypothetical protein